MPLKKDRNRGWWVRPPSLNPRLTVPRAKLPADVIDLRGRHAHNRGRYEARVEGAVRDDEPLGDAPELRIITSKEAWDYIVSIAPPGVLRRRDRLMVEEAARLYRDIHNLSVLADIEGIPSVVKAADATAFRSVLGRLGLSPADAANVTIPKRDTGNVFDD